MIPQRPVLRLPNGFDFGRISRPPFATPLIPGQNSNDRKKLTLRSCCLYTFKVIALKKTFPIKKGPLHAMAVDLQALETKLKERLVELEKEQTEIEEQLRAIKVVEKASAGKEPQ